MRFLPAFLALLLLSAPALRADGWLTDFDQAQAAAKAQNRPILINFTGPTWCPACILMEKYVFPTDTFKQYAAAKLVLMEVDVPEGGMFPEHPTPLQKKSEALLAAYRIEQFPTLLVLKPDGTLVAPLDDALASLSQSATGKITGQPDVLVKQIDAAAAKWKR